MLSKRWLGKPVGPPHVSRLGFGPLGSSTGLVCSAWAWLALPLLAADRERGPGKAADRR